MAASTSTGANGIRRVTRAAERAAIPRVGGSGQRAAVGDDPASDQHGQDAAADADLRGVSQAFGVLVGRLLGFDRPWRIGVAWRDRSVIRPVVSRARTGIALLACSPFVAATASRALLP